MFVLTGEAGNLRRGYSQLFRAEKSAREFGALLFHTHRERAGLIQIGLDNEINASKRAISHMITLRTCPWPCPWPMPMPHAIAARGRDLRSPVARRPQHTANRTNRCDRLVLVPRVRLSTPASAPTNNPTAVLRRPRPPAAHPLRYQASHSHPRGTPTSTKCASGDSSRLSSADVAASTPPPALSPALITPRPVVLSTTAPGPAAGLPPPLKDVTWRARQTRGAARRSVAARRPPVPRRPAWGTSRAPPSAGRGCRSPRKSPSTGASRGGGCAGR